MANLHSTASWRDHCTPIPLRLRLLDDTALRLRHRFRRLDEANMENESPLQIVFFFDSQASDWFGGCRLSGWWLGF